MQRRTFVENLNSLARCWNKVVALFQVGLCGYQSSSAAAPTLNSVRDVIEEKHSNVGIDSALT